MYQENYLMKAFGKMNIKAYLFTGRFEPKFAFNKESRDKGTGVYRYANTIVVRLPEIFEIINAIVFFMPFGNLLKRIRPDIIFFHGISPNIIYGLIYKLFNPSVELHIDFHTTYSNSGNSKYSKIFHTSCKLFCKIFLRYFSRVFCVAPECKTFAHEKYSIPNDRLEILPLPGIMLNDYTAKLKRSKFRAEKGLTSEVCFVHTGKMPEDKETILVLDSFCKQTDPNFRLFISGTCENGFENKLTNYISNDPRIVFLGWLSHEEFTDMLCGCEVMIQPGSLSQVFVDAICCRMPLILDDTPQGRYLTSFGNGCLSNRNLDSLEAAISELIEKKKQGELEKPVMQAAKYFDYINITKFSIDKTHTP
jgi:glycosyltransferase involved in cell wall biosynthesis